jgi:hypothetical protein
MLSSPVYAESQLRHASSVPSAFSVYSALNPIPKARHRSIARRRATISPFLIHPLCFQTLAHSFAQWTTPISFSFNRFHTLSIVMGGGGVSPSENLNYHFNYSPLHHAAPIHQNNPRPFVSTTYKLPLFYPLCFDIHPCNGGVGGGSARKFLKKNLNCFGISMETSNKRLFSRSNGRKFPRKDKQERHGEFGAGYRVQFNDSLGESRGLPATEESDPVARSGEKSILRARGGAPGQQSMPRLSLRCDARCGRNRETAPTLRHASRFRGARRCPGCAKLFRRMVVVAGF